MDIRTSISSQFNDLIKRPLSVSYGIYEALKDKSQPCKVIAARVMAASAILRAVENTGGTGNSALETILERTEGKVASDPGSAGALIQFNFQINSGAQAARQVGEVVQGVLAGVQGVEVQGVQLPAGVNPTGVDPLPLPLPHAQLTHASHAIDNTVDE